MSAVSDAIEQFIIDMLSDSPAVELQRNELAQYFSCAPSQINYVLTTRFSPDKGYIITSKRGGGGYISVSRVKLDETNLLHQLLSGGIGDTLTLSRCRAIVARLQEQNIITNREAELMLAATKDTTTVPAALRDYHRAHVFKKMLLAIAKEGK